MAVWVAAGARTAGWVSSGDSAVLRPAIEIIGVACWGGFQPDNSFDLVLEATGNKAILVQ